MVVALSPLVCFKPGAETTVETTIDLGLPINVVAATFYEARSRSGKAGDVRTRNEV